MPGRRKPVRFVEQIDQAGTVTTLQQRDIPAWRGAPDADAVERREEIERSGAYIQIFLEQMGRVESLRPSERKVFDMLVRRMNFGDPFYVSPKVLATEYGTAEKNMSAMLKTLRDQGILIRTHGLYHLLDPRLVWQGTTRARLDAIGYLKTEGLLL